MSILEIHLTYKMCPDAASLIVDGEKASQGLRKCVVHPVVLFDVSAREAAGFMTSSKLLLEMDVRGCFTVLIMPFSRVKGEDSTRAQPQQLNHYQAYTLPFLDCSDN